MDFSKRLKLLRTQKNMTQSEFASKIKVARTTYAMYEQGNREPDYEILNRIANFHDVTIDYLLGRSDTPTHSEEEEFQAFLNDPELELWYKELPENDEEDLHALKQMWEIIKKNKK